MQLQLVLLGLATLLASPLLIAATDFVQTGECENAVERHYKYESSEMYFKGSTEETTTITCSVTVTCAAVGEYGDKKAVLYDLTVSNAVVSNSALDGDASEMEEEPEAVVEGDESDGEDGSEDETFLTFHDLEGWFKFVQTEDGSIPAVFHSNADDVQAINFKKAIVTAFQANFKGTSTKLEADSQSLHKAEYTYDASAQEEGTMTMHRTVTSGDVEDYATHVPQDVVSTDTEEDLVYEKGVLTHANGVTNVKMMPETDPENDVEGDTLEAEMGARKKRDIDMSEFFDFVHDNQEEEAEEEESVVGPSTTGDNMGAANAQDTYYVYGENDNAGEQDYSYGDGSDVSEEEEAVVEGDEAVDEEEQPTYDADHDLPDFAAQGKYTLELVGERQLMGRERREAMNHLELPEATQSTLLAHFNHTHEDMEQMKQLRSQLKDITHALDEIHKDPNTTTSIVHKMVELVSLEAKYGSLSGYTPAIETVITYLQKLTGSMSERDCQMRATIYLILSREGGCESQKALVAAMDSAVNEDEERAVVVYIAFTEHPQPEMVSQLEQKIGDDIHSTNTLLFAYGALVARASPDLQQRMTMFLLNRLPLAETNTASLMHHILSLGNTESQLTTDSLIDYLSHPDETVQLSSVYALRYATGDRMVQKALNGLVSQYNVSEDHIETVLRCLLYGVEHASNTHTQPPFDLELAVSLTSSVMESGDDELQNSLINYLKLIGNEDSLNLLSFMTSPYAKEHLSNGTRLRRGSNWAESNSIYNLIASLSSRKSDVKLYPKHIAYLWGRKLGVSKANIQIAAGGFIGAGKGGQYKVYGRAKAVAHLFGKTKTALDFLVLREKRKSYTRTRILAQLAGKTLANIDIKSASTTCRRYTKNLFNANRYLLFKFVYPIPIVVTTLKVGISGYMRLNSDLYVEFCERVGSITAEGGLETTITMEVEAGISAGLLNIVRGGVTISAILNYKLTPALTTQVCLTNYRIRVKNCIGIYHQWTNNKITLDVWWERKVCKKKWGVFPICRTKWGGRNKVKGLSATWNLGSSKRKPLWRKCDKSFVCKAKPTVGVPGYRGPPGLARLRLSGPSLLDN